MDRNEIKITGRLTKAPKAVITNNGKAITEFDVAVNYRKSKDAPNKVEYFAVKTFGTNAANCGQYLDKGQQVDVEGRITIEKWESKDGKAGAKLVVLANRVTFGAKAKPKAMEKAA